MFFKALSVLAFWLATIGACGISLAAEEYEYEEGEELPAVQNRLYRMEHEILLGVGVLPVDPYTKGLSFSAGYAWHWTDLIGIEARFSYLLNIATSLRDKLENNFAYEPTRFVEIHYYGELGVLIKPIYGKLSLLNKSLLFGEFYLSLGGVVAGLNGGKKTDYEPQGKGSRVAGGGALGFGLRGFINKWFSLRLDFRFMGLYSQQVWHWPLALTLGIAFSTRSDL